MVCPHPAKKSVITIVIKEVFYKHGLPLISDSSQCKMCLPGRELTYAIIMTCKRNLIVFSFFHFYSARTLRLSQDESHAYNENNVSISSLTN